MFNRWTLFLTIVTMGNGDTSVNSFSSSPSCSISNPSRQEQESAPVPVLEFKSKDDFLLTVDYSRSLKEIAAGDHYDWWSFPDLLADLLHRENETADLVVNLVRFDHLMVTDDILKFMEKRSLRPATLPELLAFGSQYHRIQGGLPIIALGSLRVNKNGFRFVPFIERFGSHCQIRFRWMDGGWRWHYRFLAVRDN